MGEHVLLFGTIQGALSVTNGEVIGKTFTADDPSLAASEYPGANNVQPRDLTLSRDDLQAGGGAVFRLRDFEIQATYRQVLVGRNIPMIRTASTSIVYRLPNLSADSDRPPDG